MEFIGIILVFFWVAGYVDAHVGGRRVLVSGRWLTRLYAPSRILALLVEGNCRIESLAWSVSLQYFVIW